MLFHYLVTGKLKPGTMQSGGAHISTKSLYDYYITIIF